MTARHWSSACITAGSHTGRGTAAVITMTQQADSHLYRALNSISIRQTTTFNPLVVYTVSISFPDLSTAPTHRVHVTFAHAQSGGRTWTDVHVSTDGRTYTRAIDIINVGARLLSPQLCGSLRPSFLFRIKEFPCTNYIQFCIMHAQLTIMHATNMHTPLTISHIINMHDL